MRQREFRKPMLRMVSCIDRTQIIVTRNIPQGFQVMEKIKGVVQLGSIYENGITPRDLAEKLDLPQATVRRFLKQYLKQGFVTNVRVSSNCSLYKPVVKTNSVINHIVK